MGTVKLQLGQILKYHWASLLAALLLMALSRGAGMFLMGSRSFSPYLSPEAEEIFIELMEDSRDLTLEQSAAFLLDRQQQAFINGFDQPRQDALMRYQSCLQNCFEVRGYRSYARTGRGLVSLNFAEDIRTAPEKYRGFGLPSLADGDPFEKYLYLSGYSLMPIVIMLLTGTLTADGSQRGVFRQVELSAGSRGFYRGKRLIMTGLTVLLWALEELSLLIMTGALARTEYRSATLQSLPGWGTSAFRGSISQAMVFLSVRHLLCGLMCLELFTLLGMRLASVKKFILWCSGLIAVMSLAGHYVPALGPYMFAGLIPSGELLSQVSYIGPIDGSEAPAVIICFSALLGGLLTSGKRE